MVKQVRQLPKPKFSDTLTLSQPGGADYAYPLALPHLNKFCDYAPDNTVSEVVNLTTAMYSYLLSCLARVRLETELSQLYFFQKVTTAVITVSA
jgi:hypothetical protein